MSGIFNDATFETKRTVDKGSVYRSGEEETSVVASFLGFLEDTSPNFIQKGQVGFVLQSFKNKVTKVHYARVYVPRTIHSIEDPFVKLHEFMEDRSKDVYKAYIRSVFSTSRSLYIINKGVMGKGFFGGEKPLKEGQAVNVRFSDDEDEIVVNGEIASVLTDEKGKPIILDAKALKDILKNKKIYDESETDFATVQGSIQQTANIAPTATNKNKVLKIIGKFESNLNYGALNVANKNEDGTLKEFSYGIMQANMFTKVGRGENKLSLIVKNYVKNGGRYTNEFKKYSPWTDRGLANNEAYRRLLRKAGKDKVMHKVQHDFFNRYYIDPGIKYAESIGLKFPVSKLIVAYSFIQSGNKTWVRNKIKKYKDGDERQWMLNYMQWRIPWLNNPKVIPGDDIRVASVQNWDYITKMIGNNPNLGGGVRIRGSVIE